MTLHDPACQYPFQWSAPIKRLGARVQLSGRYILSHMCTRTFQGHGANFRQRTVLPGPTSHVVIYDVFGAVTGRNGSADVRVGVGGGGGAGRGEPMTRTELGTGISGGPSPSELTHPAAAWPRPHPCPTLFQPHPSPTTGRQSFPMTRQPPRPALWDTDACARPAPRGTKQKCKAKVKEESSSVTSAPFAKTKTLRKWNPPAPAPAPAVGYKRVLHLPPSPKRLGANNNGES